MSSSIKITNCNLFKKFPALIFGFSTKIGLDRSEPFYFNMSFTVGDTFELVKENREAFFNELGLSSNSIAYQKQIHSDVIAIVDNSGLIGQSDAMITNKKNLGLAISSADCAAIFIYDKSNSTISAIHSGWKGTQQKIISKTLQKLKNDFDSHPSNLYVFIGPSIHQRNYEVGREVADLFNEKYIKQSKGKLFLDIVQANYDMLSDFGIPIDQIEVSDLCSFENKDLLHSYRGDGLNSGRALGVIALKEID